MIDSINLHRVVGIEVVRHDPLGAGWLAFIFKDSEGAEFEVAAFCPRSTVIEGGNSVRFVAWHEGQT